MDAARPGQTFYRALDHFPQNGHCPPSPLPMVPAAYTAVITTQPPPIAHPWHISSATRAPRSTRILPSLQSTWPALLTNVPCIRSAQTGRCRRKSTRETPSANQPSRQPRRTQQRDGLGPWSPTHIPSSTLQGVQARKVPYLTFQVAPWSHGPGCGTGPGTGNYLSARVPAVSHLLNPAPGDISGEPAQHSKFEQRLVPDLAALRVPCTVQYSLGLCLFRLTPCFFSLVFYLPGLRLSL